MNKNEAEIEAYKTDVRIEYLKYLLTLEPNVARHIIAVGRRRESDV